MIKPTAKTCNKEVQKFTNTSYDILLELYNNTGFFRDLWEALNPGYWWDFSAGINGWQATIDKGTLINSNGYAISFGGDFYNNQLNIDADKNKILSLLMETSDIGETGSIEITYDESRVVLYEDVFEYPTGMSGILVNLDGREEHSGTITGIRFILTSDINKQFNLFKIIVGKPLINISTLIKLETDINSVKVRTSALENSVSGLNSRVNTIESKPTINLNATSLEEEVLQFEVTGLSLNGVTKTILFKNGVIELKNSNNSSYFRYNVDLGIYEYKGKIILPDGTEIDSIEDIRALDGADGDYQEFRFARSNTKPTLINTEPNPVNFSLAPPSGTLPIWFIVTKKRANGTLLNTWSEPAKLSGDAGTSSEAVIAYLTSENYIAISNPDGTNPNLSAGGGEFVLTKNGAKVTSGVNYSGGVTKNGLTLIINSSNGLFNLTGVNWTTDVEFFDLTATFEGKSYTKRYSVVKQKGSGSGGGGSNTITLLLYKATVRAATSLTGPSGPVTFNLSTLTLTEDSTDALNGWSLLMPENTLPKRWVTQALISTTASTIQIQPAQWSTPRVFSIDGVDGEDGSGTGEGLDGFSRATVYAYKAAETIAANDNPGDTVYTFATGVATLSNGWQSSIPSSVLPVWVRTGLAISRDAVDTINSNEWSDAVKITGASLNTAQLFIYKRTASSTPPDVNDKPTASAAYNFETGILSGLNNGWTNIPPLSSGKYLWVRAAMASSTTLTDNIAPTEWSEPRLLASDGSDGTGGSGEAYPGAERKGGTYVSFNWNATGADSATTRWGALTGRSPVAGDVFIQVNSSTGATEVRAYNGTAWVVPAAVYESLVTFGVLSGDQILAGSVINAPVIRGGSIELVGNNASSFIKISRNDPFGPNNLIEWYGPKINGVTWNVALNAPIYSGMTKANAVTYYGADGTWYTSGSILAGTFRNSARTNLLIANPEIELGPFGSNGGLLTVKVSFGASRGSGVISGTCPVEANPNGTIYLDKWNGTQWIQVASEVMSGEYSCSQEGPEYIQSWWLSGSFTFTDSVQSTATRRFRARATHNTPLLPDGTLNLSIISEE